MEEYKTKPVVQNEESNHHGKFKLPFKPSAIFRRDEDRGNEALRSTREPRYSPDGKSVVFFHHGAFSVFVADVPEFKNVRELEWNRRSIFEHEEAETNKYRVEDVCFIWRNGKPLLIICTHGGGLSLWDIDTGKIVDTIVNVHDGPLSDSGYAECVNATENGKFVAVGYDNEIVRVYDTNKHALIATLEAGKHGFVRQLHFSPFYPKLLAVVYGGLLGDRSAVIIWDVEKNRIAHRLSNDKTLEIPKSVCFSKPDRFLLFIGYSQGPVAAWDFVSDEYSLRFGESTGYEDLRLSIDTKFLFGYSKETARVWDAQTGECLVTIPCRRSIVSADMSPSADRVIISTDREYLFWDLCDRSPVRNEIYDRWLAISQLETTDTDIPRFSLMTLNTRRTDKQIRRMCISPNSELLVTGEDGGWVNLWDLKRNCFVDTLEGLPPDRDVTSLAWSSNGKYIAASAGKAVAIWLADTRELFKLLKIHHRDVVDVHFSLDSTMLLSAGEDEVIRPWVIEGGHVKGGHQLTGRSLRGCPCSTSHSPDGKEIVACYSDGRMECIEENKQIEMFPGVMHVTFSPDNEHVAICGRNNTISVQRIPPVSRSVDRHPTSFYGRDWSVVHLKGESMTSNTCFYPGGRFLAASGNDRLVHLWDTESKPPRRFMALRGHSRSVLWTCFSPDGLTLVTTDGSTVLVWDLLGLKPSNDRIKKEKIEPGKETEPDKLYDELPFALQLDEREYFDDLTTGIGSLQLRHPGTAIRLGHFKDQRGAKRKPDEDDSSSSPVKGGRKES